MRLGILMVLLTVGCNGKDEDSDTGPNTDDTDIDIPDTFLGRTDKPSDVERVGASLQAGLIAVTVEADGSWTLGAFLTGGKLSGTGNFGLVLPETAPAADIRSLPGGRTGALYLPVVFDDVNKDGMFADNSDDLVLGFADARWLTYLEAGAGDELTGWSVVDANPDDWSQYKLTEQAEVYLHGLSATARLEGIYEGTDSNIGVLAVDERTLAGEGYAEWLALDVAVDAEGGKFDVTVDVRPPVEAFQFPEGAPRFVRAIGQFYSDDNASGAYEADQDTLLDRGLCFDGKPLVARFVDTPRTIALARDIRELRWTTGWRFVTGPAGTSTEISRTDLRWYRYDDGCAL